MYTPIRKLGIETIDWFQIIAYHLIGINVSRSSFSFLLQRFNYSQKVNGILNVKLLILYLMIID